MARRVRSIREMRQEYEAAEARGLVSQESTARPRGEPREPTRPKPSPAPKMKVVWAVCDMGNRVVATYDYPQKTEAEAHADQLKARGKGKHFVRAEKVPMG
jgi:hypothetical protein